VVAAEPQNDCRFLDADEEWLWGWVLGSTWRGGSLSSNYRRANLGSLPGGRKEDQAVVLLRASPGINKTAQEGPICRCRLIRSMRLIADKHLMGEQEWLRR
jgi:hypothetical protein